MPRIPTFTDRPSMIPEAPPGVDINPGAFSRVQDSLANAGATAAGIGIDLMDKRKKAQDEDYVFQKEREDARSLAKFMADEQLKRDNTGYDGFSTSVQQFVEERYQKNQEDAPSETARREYMNRAGRLFTAELVNANGIEHTKKVEAKMTAFSKNADSDAQLQLTYGGKFDSAMDAIESAHKSIDAQKGVLFSPKQAEEQKKAYGNRVAQSFFDGLYNSGRLEEGYAYLMGAGSGAKKFVGHEAASAQRKEYSVDEAEKMGWISKEEATKARAEHKDKISFAEATLVQSDEGMDLSPVKDISKMLSPDQREKEIQRFKKAMKTKAKVDMQEIHAMINDEQAGILLHGRESPAVPQVLKQLVDAKVISNDKRVRLMDERVSAGAAHLVMTDAATSPRSQWEPTIKGLAQLRQKRALQELEADPSLKNVADPNYNLVNRYGYEVKARAALEKLKKAQDDDPAKYVRDYFPTLRSQLAQAGNDPVKTQRAVDRLLTVQKHLEIPEQRILTNDELYQHEAAFKSGNAQQVANQVSFLQQKYGKHYNRVIGELIANKSMPAGYQMIANLQNPEDRVRMADALKNGHETLKMLRENTDEQTMRQLDAAVVKQTDDMRASVLGSDRTGTASKFVNDVQTSVKVEAAKILMKNKGMKPEDAVAEAYSIWGNTYTTMNSGRSRVAVPRILGPGPDGKPMFTNDKIVTKFMEAYSRPENLSKLNIALPKATPADIVRKIPDDKRREMLLDDLSRNGRWKVTDDQTGLQLMWDRGGKTSQTIEVKNTKGEKVIVPLRDIHLHTDDATLREIEGGKGIMEKVGDALFGPKKSEAAPEKKSGEPPGAREVAPESNVVPKRAKSRTPVPADLKDPKVQELLKAPSKDMDAVGQDKDDGEPF